MAELQQDPQPYELPEDDAYDERCAEVHITFKRHLVFHCCFCAQKYGNYRNFLKHFSKEHFDDDDEVDATVSDLNEDSVDKENSKNSLDVAKSAEYFDKLEEQFENNDELVFIEQHVDYAEQPEDTNYVQTKANNDDEYMHVEKLEYDLQTNDFMEVQETNEILEEEYIVDEDDNYEHTNEDIVSDTNAKQNAETFDKVLLDTVKNPHNKAELINKNNIKTTIKLAQTKPLAKPLPKGKSLLSLKQSGKPPIKPEARITKFMQKPKPFQCNVCQKIFSKKCRLDMHMKIHSDERRFKCIICGVAFKDKSNCKSHIRRHTEEKNFKCKFCAKAFFSRTECSIHERTHTGEKPYICALCGKRFVAACSLTTHAKRHEDVRQFKCDVCERSFHLRAKLREHMVVHTGERPYHCKICSATFTRPQSLTQHKKLHVNALAYACKMCDKRFNQKPALISHMKSNHKVMDNTESAF